ncbi:MAG: CHAT domain-containing protein [Acidobacteriota bacterium]|nr:CHAT domain-containing protein [Acidobacteriota bacterium]
MAANSDGEIPGVEQEVAALDTSLKRDLGQLGLRLQIDILRSQEATYDRVEEELRDGRHHILHYAGHGRRDTTLPEIGGLILHCAHKSTTLTAANLSTLVKGSELRLVFLSCCFGAFSTEPGRGDFHGVFDALAGADVPAIVGYRWKVSDEVALTFATSFYQNLWRTLSPGDAVLAARQECALKWTLDEPTWASPILLLQSS